jgi:hypothetical protein
MATQVVGQGVGASVRRVEDRRLGGGEYLADLRVPGTVEIAFLRRPVAHARLKAVDIPVEFRGSVFLASSNPSSRRARRRASNIRDTQRSRVRSCASSARRDSLSEWLQSISTAAPQAWR